MAMPMLTSARVLALLAESPPRIAAVTAGLTAVELRTAPGEGAWAANDVLAECGAAASRRSASAGRPCGRSIPAHG